MPIIVNIEHPNVTPSLLPLKDLPYGTVVRYRIRDEKAPLCIVSWGYNGLNRLVSLEDPSETWSEHVPAFQPSDVLGVPKSITLEF